MELSVLKKGVKVAAAVSGGIDSMVLLEKLNEVKDEIGFELSVVNVNHNLRPASLNDSKFVEAYVKKLGIKFSGFSVDVSGFAKENKLSTESAARLLRYQAFDGVDADYIALAHHMSDQAETVLMNIIRGSGLNGAAGMKLVNGKYIRPLLYTTKAEIRNYQSERNIPYVEDETNACNEFTRNFIRNEVMPLLNRVNVKAEENICKFAQRLKDDEDFLRELALNESVKIDGGTAALPVQLFNSAQSLWKRQTLYVLTGLGVTKDIEARHLELIKELAISGKSGARFDLPYGVKVFKDYETLTLTTEESKLSGKTQRPFSIGSFLMDGKLVTVAEGDGRFRFDLDKVPQTAVFRYRREGDIFTKKNGGTKKLKDFLIDKKIPQRKRDSLIVLADGSEVLFAEGVETSGKIWTDENTRRLFSVSINPALADDTSREL